MAEPEVNDLHKHLMNLIEGSTMHWNYAVLWRRSYRQGVLNFHDGYYRGTGKPKEVCILGSCLSATEEVTDAEWFFKISMGQSFGLSNDLPGYAFMGSSPVWVNAKNKNASNSRWGVRHKWGTWERAKWGHQFGIQTFLCIPLRKGKVLELASTEIIPYHLKGLKGMADFIYRIGTPRRPIKPLVLKKSRKDKGFRERAEAKTQNCGNANSSKQSRGKEKLSDSKCSWPLLSDSSDRGTDGTFSNSHDYSGPS